MTCGFAVAAPTRTRSGKLSTRVVIVLRNASTRRVVQVADLRLLDVAWTSGGSTGTTAIADGNRDVRASGSTGKSCAYMDGWKRSLGVSV